METKSGDIIWQLGAYLYKDGKTLKDCTHFPDWNYLSHIKSYMGEKFHIIGVEEVMELFGIRTGILYREPLLGDAKVSPRVGLFIKGQLMAGPWKDLDGNNFQPTPYMINSLLEQTGYEPLKDGVKLSKRVKKTAKKILRANIPDKIIEKACNYSENKSYINIDFDNNFNWFAGEFGDEISCFAPDADSYWSNSTNTNRKQEFQNMNLDDLDYSLHKMRRISKYIMAMRAFKAPAEKRAIDYEDHYKDQDGNLLFGISRVLFSMPIVVVKKNKYFAMNRQQKKEFIVENLFFVIKNNYGYSNAFYAELLASIMNRFIDFEIITKKVEIHEHIGGNYQNASSTMVIHSKRLGRRSKGFMDNICANMRNTGEKRMDIKTAYTIVPERKQFKELIIL